MSSAAKQNFVSFIHTSKVQFIIARVTGYLILQGDNHIDILRTILLHNFTMSSGLYPILYESRSDWDNYARAPGSCIQQYSY